MEKPNFKMSKEEMIEFHDDCWEAVSHCPQSRYNENYPICGPYSADSCDREILRGNIRPSQLVRAWMKDDTLFNHGYKKCLSVYAQEVFRRYKLYKSLLRVFMDGGKL